MPPTKGESHQGPPPARQIREGFESPQRSEFAKSNRDASNARMEFGSRRQGGKLSIAIAVPDRIAIIWAKPEVETRDFQARGACEVFGTPVAQNPKEQSLLRPPFAREAITNLQKGVLRIHFKQPTARGTTYVDVVLWKKERATDGTLRESYRLTAPNYRERRLSP